MFKKEIFGKTNIKSSERRAKILVFLFIFLIIIIILFLSSKIVIELKDVTYLSGILKNKQKNKKDSLRIKLCILNKIPILSIKVTKKLIEKLKIKEKFKKIDINNLEEDKNIFRKILEITKTNSLKIENLDLKIELGTENAALTAVLIPIISTIISIIIRRKVKDFEKQSFQIKPINNNQNILNIALSGIFQIKMIHIINIIYILNKKEGVKNYERTSNRRAYGYSYE